MTKDEWAAYVAADGARAADEARTETLMGQLSQAERLLFYEGYTTDDPWPGIIYLRGRDGSERRVDVEVWVMMRALARGMGSELIRARPRDAVRPYVGVS